MSEQVNPLQIKVCHITSMHGWDDDRIYQRACLGLAKSGHNVTLIATGDRDSNDGLNHITLKERKGLRRRVFSTLEAVKKSLKQKDSILHFHDPEFLPFVFLYRLLGVKVVFDSHEVFSVRLFQWKGIPNLFRPTAASVYFWFEARLMRRFHALIVTSDSMKEMYEKHNKNVLVVRNLHSLEVLKSIETVPLEHKWNKPVIYTSGVIGPDRNSDKMLFAFSKIAKIFPNATLRYAGWYTGNYQSYLEKLAKDLNLEDRVECLGSVPYLDQFKRSTEASIGFVLLKKSRKNKVASSNRLFEYMFCELPIIVENTQECKKVIDFSKAGKLVDSNDIEQLALTLEELLSNFEMSKAYGENGKSAVLKKFHFEKDISVLIKMYNTCVNDFK